MNVAMTVLSILAQKDRLGDEKLVAALVIFPKISTVSAWDVCDDSIKALI